MTDAEKIEKLKAYYKDRTDPTARDVLDSFASKSRWRNASLVHRIVQETGLAEQSVRSFLKDKLQDELELGVLKKGGASGKPCFVWDAKKGYSLILVGKAAKGASKSLREIEDDDAGSDDLDDWDWLQESLKLSNGRQLKIEFPSDLTEKEFDYFSTWFRMITFDQSGCDPE